MDGALELPKRDPESLFKLDYDLFNSGSKKEDNTQKLLVHSHDQDQKNKKEDDHTYLQWTIEQKFKTMEEQKYPYKRMKYWGEPQDCSTYQ